MSNTQRRIAEICDEIKELLIAKNRAYGDSVIDPVRLFSQASPVEQIKVRLDDKLSRLSRGTDTEAVPEDTIKDLIGYLVLLLIAETPEDADEPKEEGEWVEDKALWETEGRKVWISGPRAKGGIYTPPNPYDPPYLVN